MNAMQKLAALENATLKEHWGVQERWPSNVSFNVDDPDFETKLVPRVMSHLRAGDGVEDMQVKGTCTADEARQIISWMRANGSLSKFYQRQVKS